MVKLRLKKQISGVVDLYNKVAEQMGYDYKECEYDCREIEVSEDIEEEIRRNYEDPEEFGMIWIIYGPKMNKDLPENTVAISDKFIKKYELPTLDK